MKNFRNKLLACLLVCIIIFTCFAVTVSASDPTDVDFYGENICDSMYMYLCRWVYDFFINSDCQISPTSSTTVFVDYQLIEYGFLDHIIQALNAYGYFHDVTWANIRSQTGISFLVHMGNYTFIDLEIWANGGGYQGYDFSTDTHFDVLNNAIYSRNMCALGVWYPGDDLYTFTKLVQDMWNDNFPVYYIYRDHISIGNDGLIFKVYDSIERVFYNCTLAPGVSFQ